MGGPSWEISFCNWIFIISLQPITLSNTAVPIDIVTEKVSGDVPLKPKIIQMIPDKKPLIPRRQFFFIPPRRVTPRRTTKTYALFLKYYDSHYVEYYDDLPYLTIKPNKYPVPGLPFGGALAKQQVSSLLSKMVFGGGARIPRPQGTFQPPHVIHIPEEIENYTYVNFHFNKTSG